MRGSSLGVIAMLVFVVAPVGSSAPGTDDAGLPTARVAGAIVGGPPTCPGEIIDCDECDPSPIPFDTAWDKVMDCVNNGP
jgi:hypothetical protein